MARGQGRRRGLTAAAVWLGCLSTNQQSTTTSAINLDENSKEIGYVLTPLQVRRELRNWRPPKAENEFVMFDHETKQCDELPAINPCFTYQQEQGVDSFLVSSVDVGHHTSYEQNWHCGKILLAPAGYTLEINWVEFDLYLGDTVKIWDGCSNVQGERLIISEATGAKRPTRLVSQMECLYIEFKTTERWQRGGFNASITCNPPMAGGVLGPAGPGYFEEECFQYWANTGLAHVDCFKFLHPGVQCWPLQEDVEHGQVVMHNERWYPSVATYECDPGYEVCNGVNNTAQNCRVGDDDRHCMPSKVYNGTTPECVGIICDEADRPDGARLRYRKASNGAPAVDPDRQYPCFVEYACAPGYILNATWDPAASERRRCNSRGLWEGLAPRCTAIACPEFAGPPGVCVCSNGYDGIPAWDDDNAVWLHTCGRDHLDNRTYMDPTVSLPFCIPPATPDLRSTVSEPPACFPCLCCVRLHACGVSVRAQGGSGSWEDPYTGTECIENEDEDGHTCSSYVAAGYACALMMSEYNYDCHCACE